MSAAEYTGYFGLIPKHKSPPREIVGVGEWIVVRRRVREKSEGGIIIPDAAQKPTHEADVVAAADGRGVKAGDVVLLAQYSGHEVEVDGARLVCVKETDILCVLRTKET